MRDEATREQLKKAAWPARIRGTCMAVTQGWPPVYCTRNGTMMRVGKLSCRQHDPGDPEENRWRRMAQLAEREAREGAERAARERRELEEQACRGLSNGELRAYIAAGGIVFVEGL
jgi:hypothetical protein